MSWLLPSRTYLPQWKRTLSSSDHSGASSLNISVPIPYILHCHMQVFHAYEGWSSTWSTRVLSTWREGARPRWTTPTALLSSYCIDSYQNYYLYQHLILYIIMKYRAINNIEEYDSLIQKLNPTGHYQLRLYLLCFLSWAFAGLTKTTFDECFEK